MTLLFPKPVTNLRAVIDNEKWVTDMVRALQIARVSAFYSQLVWFPIEIMLQMDKKKSKIV